MKTKICFVATVQVTLNTFLVAQSKRLIEEGWEVHWASSVHTDQNSVPNGVKFHSIPLSRSPSLFQIVGTILVLLGIFRREKFSVVQFSSPIASLCTVIASKVARVPVRIYAQWGIRYVGLKGVKRNLLKLLEKLTCSLSSVIQPDSFGNLEFAAQENLYPRSKGQVVGNGSACGVDLQSFNLELKTQHRGQIRSQYGIADSAFVFGFVGSVRTDKGINEAVSAFMQLPQEDCARSVMMLVGDTHFIGDLAADVRQALSSSDSIVMTGPVTGVERYISAFDCLVFPSYREGFGMVVVESAAMAVPAIVTDIPGPSEAVEDGVTGRIVPLKDATALSISMQSYLCEPDVAITQGLAARELVEQKYERNVLMEAFIKNKQTLLERALSK